MIKKEYKTPNFVVALFHTQEEVLITSLEETVPEYGDDEVRTTGNFSPLRSSDTVGFGW